MMPTVAGKRRKMPSASDWDEFFRRRPDLSPPGYHEAIKRAEKRSEERRLERA